MHGTSKFNLEQSKYTNRLGAYVDKKETKAASRSALAQAGGEALRQLPLAELARPATITMCLPAGSRHYYKPCS